MQLVSVDILLTTTFSPPHFLLTGHPSVCHVLASHVHAALAADWALCWSVLPLLDATQPLPGPLTAALGLKSPPPLKVVLQHMQRVSQALLCGYTIEVQLRKASAHM